MKVVTLPKKSEWKREQGKILKLQAFGSSYARDKSHFEDGGFSKLFSISPNAQTFLKICSVRYFSKEI